MTNADSSHAESSSTNSTHSKLPLYGYMQCPYTAKVFKRASQLGIELELRDINVNPQYHEELLIARKVLKSPVLRTLEQKWLPESADIIAYLEQQVGYTRPAWQAPLALFFLAACISSGVFSLVVKGTFSSLFAGLAVVFMLAWRSVKR